MKWLWVAIASIEGALLAWFCVWASSADYFVRMPASVRHGSSVGSIVAMRAAWLAAVFGIFNVSVAAWIYGVRTLETKERESGILAMVGGVVMFLVACWLLALLVFFGLAQY